MYSTAYSSDKARERYIKTDQINSSGNKLQFLFYFLLMMKSEDNKSIERNRICSQPFSAGDNF